jgi:hypothetical protein
LRPIALHYLVALLAMIFIAGVAPRAILLTGGPELPGSGELSSPLPVFILSMLVSAFLLWELVRTLRGKATIEAVQLEKQHEALHDPLTGAANRRNFELSLREAIELTDPRHAL